MLTTEQTFKGVIFKEIKVKHKIYGRNMDLYDIQIEQDNKVVILTLDNLESILKVVKRNFKWNKEVSQKDKRGEEEINEVCKSCGEKTKNGDLLCEACKEHFRKVDKEFEREDSI